MRLSRKAGLIMVAAADTGGGSGNTYKIHYVDYGYYDVSSYFPNAPKEAESGSSVVVPEADDNYQLWFFEVQDSSYSTISYSTTFIMPESDVYVIYEVSN